MFSSVKPSDDYSPANIWMPVLGNSEPFVKIHLPLHREWRGWDCMELEGASSCIQSQPSSDSNCMRDPRKASKRTVQLSLGNPQNCEREQHGGYLKPLNFGVICSALVGDQNNEEARSFNWEAENLLFFFLNPSGHWSAEEITQIKFCQNFLKDLALQARKHGAKVGVIFAIFGRDDGHLSEGVTVKESWSRHHRADGGFIRAVCLSIVTVVPHLGCFSDTQQGVHSRYAVWNGHYNMS